MPFQFYVPIEIVEVIIDHLHNDNEALKACSLVSRRWVFSSRYHLVYPIKLHHKNITDFLDLLQSPCSKIAPSIRDLSFISIVQERNWMPSALSTIEKHLTHVKNLTLHGVRWSRLDSTTTTSFFRGFQSVTHLTVKAGAFSSFSQCVEFICSFPALTTLTANKCQWDSNTAAPPSPRFTLSRRLTTLAIDTPPNTLTQWLTNQPCARTLRKVSIEFIDTDHGTSVRNFLRRIKARDMEAFRVGFKEIYGQRNITHREFGMGEFSKLRELTVVVGVLDQPARNGWSPYDLHWVPPFLSKVSSDSLVAVKLRFLVLDTDCLTLDWKELDRTLNLPSFLKLQKLTFSMAVPYVAGMEDEGWDVLEHFEYLVNTRLPGCIKRGIVRTEYGPEQDIWS
ncbi:hypothetical protein K443DRAFT_681875 [Laccaria amethystina LaAM-08-1]|uniref:F-box domain-containing protein n=1 Tax=Laccaria amethystina LaAM-08-1 TaxID=1095629 RepID=A0A0C9WWK2_9AGAR|nr:hypothetical protein K443DRAFT_681875 [Laccaria amethystina LaAM-08-1]